MYGIGKFLFFVFQILYKCITLEITMSRAIYRAESGIKSCTALDL